MFTSCLEPRPVSSYHSVPVEAVVSTLPSIKHVRMKKQSFAERTF